VPTYLQGSLRDVLQQHSTLVTAFSARKAAEERAWEAQMNGETGYEEWAQSRPLQPIDIATKRPVAAPSTASRVSGASTAAQTSAGASISVSSIMPSPRSLSEAMEFLQIAQTQTQRRAAAAAAGGGVGGVAGVGDRGSRERERKERERDGEEAPAQPKDIHGSGATSKPEVIDEDDIMTLVRELFYVLSDVDTIVTSNIELFHQSFATSDEWRALYYRIRWTNYVCCRLYERDLCEYIPM
jgi:hypothetical protein